MNPARNNLVGKIFKDLPLTFLARKGEGFTLLETIIAVGIITMALVGILGLLASTISLGKDIRANHIAANLSQEGIEIIHNMRHTNWVLQQSIPTTAWDAGLSDGDSCVSYDSTSLISSPCPALRFDEDESDKTLRRYNYSAGDATQFVRTINLSHETDLDGVEFIRVLSTVAWEENTIITEDHLYDWK